MSNILVNTIKDTGNNTLLSSDGSGSVTLGSGFPQNTPAFRARMSGAQSFTGNVNTKVNFNTVVYDTDSGYDTSNYRYTVPTGKGGKYWFYASVMCSVSSNDHRVQVRYYVNGTETIMQYVAGITGKIMGRCDTALTLSASDYVECYILTDSTSSQTIDSDTKASYWGGYKIIGA
jgi:hypothetical protein